MPVGQRAVNVLRGIWKRTPSMPCTAISPNNERFQPPKLWNAIGAGIGTIDADHVDLDVGEFARGAAVAGEDRDAVAVFVVVDELGRTVEIGGAHDREHRPEISSL
jgi:hypothetical protein